MVCLRHREVPLSWVNRGSCGIICRIQENAVASGRAASQGTVKRGPAARSGQSGHSKVAQGKFRPQQCQLNCDVLLSLVSPVDGGSRFTVLEDPELDDCASGAAPRPRKTALQQVSPTDDKRVSCSRKQDNDTSVTCSDVRGRTDTHRQPLPTTKPRRRRQWHHN